MVSRNPLPQYCLMENGKEKDIFCGTRKEAIAFYKKHNPGEKIYYRFSPTRGFVYEEVEV